MRVPLALAAAAAILFCGAARADTINTFAFNSTLQSGTATGNLTLDATTGSFTNANISFLYLGTTTSYSGAPTLTSLQSNYYRINFTNPGLGGFFDIDLPVTSLVGYAGGSLCTFSASCTGAVSGAGPISGLVTDAVTSGSLKLTSSITPTSPAVTPEPSSLLLLGTGVLVLGVLLRSKYV